MTEKSATPPPETPATPELTKSEPATDEHGKTEPTETAKLDSVKSESAVSESADPETTNTETTNTGVPASTSGKRSGKRTALIAAGVVVVLAVLAALGWGGYTIWQKSAVEDARASALDSGSQFATDLATYNYQNLDQNLAIVRDNSVGEFAGQYAQVASNLQNMIVQYQATSSAKILSAGLASADRDNAEVLVFLDQTITNTNSPDPRIDRNRMQLSLVREDGKWKLSKVQLL